MAFKKLTALTLALLMVFGASATVAQEARTLEGNTYTSGLPVLETPETFKIAISMDSNSKNTMAEKYSVMEAAKQTNINIEWIEIPSSGWTEKVNIMIASNDLPDAFLGEVDVVSNTEIFQPLDELINVFAPNIQEMFTKTRR